MRAKEWAAVAALMFGVLGIGFGLEAGVGGATSPDAAPDAEAFRKTLSFTLEPGARERRTSFAIPRGKRLILEFATASVSGGRDAGFTAKILTQGSAEDVLEHRLGLAPGERKGTLEAAQPLRAFADAETTVVVALERKKTGETAAGMSTLFGYLIDVP